MLGSVSNQQDLDLHDHGETKTARRSLLTRRSFFTVSTGTTALVSSLLTLPANANAAEPSTSTMMKEEQTQVGMVSTDTLADRLHAVPTFTIVDPKGVPYMVVGEDAKVTGYFFTTYEEADRLLTLARNSASDNIREARQELRASRKNQGLPPLSKQDEVDQVGTNPWKSARISTVPLDVAVTLVTKSMYSTKSSGGGNYFQVAPAETDVVDALALDKSGKEELAEGRVPLFYLADFEINDNGVKQSPLYFCKSELLDDWKKLHPLENNDPQVLVTEMFSVLTEMVKPGGKDEDLQTLVFVPPKKSAQKAKDCVKKGGKEAQFLVGQRIVVL